jgi:mannose-6-phosphate isomerase
VAYEIVIKEYADDAGALITPLLAYLALSKGEAVFLPAGVPHSYIRGIGVEVMTSSDNVVRLGLTSKPVFVDHALKAINDELHPQVMRVHIGDLIWPVNAPFVVRLLESGKERMPTGAYRIALAIEGKSSIVFEDAEITIQPGRAAVMSAQDPDADVEAHGLVAVIQSTILTQA